MSGNCSISQVYTQSYPPFIHSQIANVDKGTPTYSELKSRKISEKIGGSRVETTGRG
jgi:hypothetical protein